MKKIVNWMSVAVLSAVFGVMDASASTRVIFSPDSSKAFLMVQTVGGGGADGDSLELFDGMNVPTTPTSGGGTGKVIRTDNDSLNWSCVLREARTRQVMCTIVVKASGDSEISPAKGVVRYSARGALAQWFLDRLIPGSDGTYFFESQERTLTIRATSESFELAYERR